MNLNEYMDNSNELKRKAHGEEDSEEVIGYRHREIDTSDPMNVTKCR